MEPSQPKQRMLFPFKHPTKEKKPNDKKNNSAQCKLKNRNCANVPESSAFV